MQKRLWSPCVRFPGRRRLGCSWESRAAGAGAAAGADTVATVTASRMGAQRRA